MLSSVRSVKNLGNLKLMTSESGVFSERLPRLLSGEVDVTKLSFK